MTKHFSSSSLASAFDSPNLSVTVGAYSVQGKSRETNEDCEFVSLKHDLFIVSDGMGGHAAGERASRFAVDSLSNELAQLNQEVHSADEVTELVEAALEHANCLILDAGRSNPELQGAETTVVLALLFGRRLFVTGVGDSRAYLFRRGDMEQLTNDDSFAAAMELAGVITHEQARKHPARHLLLNALGMEEFHPSDHVRIIDVKEGDRFLLCTNGITEVMDDDEIQQILEDHDDSIVAARELVEQAVGKGATDDATSLVFAIHCVDVVDVPIKRTSDSHGSILKRVQNWFRPQ